MAGKLNRVPEAAEQLNVSAKCIWNWVAESRIDVIRLGRCVRIPQRSIDKLIEEGLVRAKSA